VNYTFPTITHIDQVRDAIAGRSEFIEADRGDHVIFNYLVNFEDTFPPVTDERSAILRECRGLVFDRETGKVIGRRFHKFFNLGERTETRFIDFSEPHVILEKLDGSMINFFQTSEGRIVCGTKMGDTDVAKNAAAFVEARFDYGEFVRDMVSIKASAMFEWCSRKNRIVVDYPEDRLVLTAMRDNETGAYLDYDSMVVFARMYDLEVIKKFDLTIDEAAESLSSIEDEGYVVRFDDGHMLKMKGSHYVQLHKTMEHMQHEKDLIRLIVDDKLDDAKPFLPEDLVSRLDEFGFSFFKNLKATADDIAWEVIQDTVTTLGSKKEFAMLVRGKEETKVRFRAYDYLNDTLGGLEGRDIALERFVYDELVARVKGSLGTSTKVDSVRHLWGGLRWET
jgi:RNA ligase